MTTRETVSLGQFRFECGESIPNLELAYESYGEFTGDNAVLVCHALTGSQHVARVARSATEQSSGTRDSTGRTAEGSAERDGVNEMDGQARAWWDDIVGPGKAIDTTEQFVICANVPGSCYGSTGPPSTNPDTGEPYGTNFPAVTVEDWTRAQRRLLDELDVPHLQAVVGGSVGGMNVLEWVKRYPEMVERAIPIAAAARLDPQCVALDGVARRAITTDANWDDGDYYDGPEPDDGLALARQLGHVMYLSKDSMERKFGRRAAGRDAARDDFPADPAADYFPYRDVESYLDYQSGKFTDRFDANSYLYLTRAMDNYDLSAGCASDSDALSAFDGEVLVMSFTGDWHFTTAQSEALAEAFRAAGVETTHHVIGSGHGHDAFLVEPENVGPPLADFIEHGVAGRAVTDTHGDRGTAFAPVHASLFGN